ncbi:hypothetical protein [Actinacidiphila sp. bgisy160]|uniref:hypothetical protein n=1 Tax=Actinacidiphila sp. bgisy160 TaxID=3413796 RepID=UPI003D752F1C
MLALLGRHRNVAARINGHGHKKKIVPQGTFWEVSTVSHVGHPAAGQDRRADRRPRRHALAAPHALVESAAPYRTDFTDLSQTGLAALHRELSRSTRQGPVRSPASRATATWNCC